MTDGAHDHSDGYEGYLCWTPSHVPDLVKVDATSPHPSELLAVHHPSKIRLDSTSGKAVSEQEVLESLLDPTQTLRIVPILGEAGTGKSHLVQWLRARVTDRPDLTVVYLPRSRTGLRGVIEILLEQLDDGDSPGVSELRSQLAEAFSDGSTRDLAGELIDAMSRAMELVAEEEVDPSGDRKVMRRRKGLALTLPNLFRDPVGREFFLRPGGPIQRFVDDQTATRTDPDADGEGFVFSVEDFPEADRLERFDELGTPAKKALSDISSALEMRQSAAELTSEAMNDAIPAVLGMTGQVTLTSVFQATRRALLSSGQELVLLIEDLSRLQGVDRELLNALLDNPEEDGEQVLCNLRVAIAVTSGYYRRVGETLESRAEFAMSKFVLDVPYGNSADTWTDQDLYSFVGRYLNSIRIGSSALRDAYDAATPDDRRRSDWIPNGCEGCPHIAKCHESFGEVDGVGLYPFNPTALVATAHAVLGDRVFNPRRILGRVVHRTLVDFADDIANKRFPSMRYSEQYQDIPPLLGNALTDIGRTPDAERREVLLRIWGDAPSEVVDLPEGIHEAFGIPEVGKRLGEAGPQRHPSDGPHTPPPAPSPPPSTEPGERAAHEGPTPLEEWANGGPLPRSSVVSIQDMLFRQVVSRVDWAVLGVTPEHPFLVGKSAQGLSRVLRPFSFHIEDALGRENDDTEVTFQLSRERHREFLLLIERSSAKGSLIGLGLPAYDLVQVELDAMAAQVAESILRIIDPSKTESPVAYISQRLALGALADGRIDPHSDVLRLCLAALLPPISNMATGTGRWDLFRSKLLEKESELRRELIGLAEYRQGRAVKPSIVRSGRLAESLHRLVEDWSLSRQIPQLPALLGADISPVTTRDIQVGSSEEIARLKETLSGLQDLLGESPWDLLSMAPVLRRAISDAERVGCFQADPSQFRILIEALGNFDSQLISQTAPQLDIESATTGERLAACGMLHRAGVIELSGLVTRLQDQLVAALQLATERLESERDSPADNPLDRTLAAARGLSEQLEALA